MFAGSDHLRTESPRQRQHLQDLRVQHCRRLVHPKGGPVLGERRDRGHGVRHQALGPEHDFVRRRNHARGVQKIPDQPAEGDFRRYPRTFVRLTPPKPLGNGVGIPCSVRTNLRHSPFLPWGFFGPFPRGNTFTGIYGWSSGSSPPGPWTSACAFHWFRAS